MHHEGQRRSIFLRYLGEVADAVSSIRPVDREKLLEKLVAIARRKTAEADLRLDEHGQLIDPEELNDGSVLIVENAELGPDRLSRWLPGPERSAVIRLALMGQ